MAVISQCTHVTKEDVHLFVGDPLSDLHTWGGIRGLVEYLLPTHVDNIRHYLHYLHRIDCPWQRGERPAA